MSVVDAILKPKDDFKARIVMVNLLKVRGLTLLPRADTVCTF